MNDKNNEHRQIEEGATSRLPSHIHEFIDLSKELEGTMKADDAIAITQARSMLKIFYGTLSEDQQRDIQTFIEREVAGMRIEDERSSTNQKMHRVLNAPYLVVHALAETVPQLTSETIRLIVTTLGLSIAGLWKGARTTYDYTFKKAA